MVAAYYWAVADNYFDWEAEVGDIVAALTHVARLVVIGQATVNGAVVAVVQWPPPCP